MKRVFPVLVFLAGGALLLTLLVRNTDRGPFERAPLGMEALYWSTALQSSSAGMVPDAGARPPHRIYGLVLGQLASDDLSAIPAARRLLTLVSLPLFAAAVLVLSWRRAGPWPAVLAALATLVAGPLVVGAGTLTPAVPATLILLAAIIVLDARPRTVSWVLAGVLIGLAGRFDSQLCWVLFALLMAGAFFHPPEGKRFRVPAALAGGWLGVLVLTALIDTTAPVVPKVSGIEVYRGHRSGASGVNPRRGDADSLRWWGTLDFVREASRNEDRRLTLAEAETYWGSRALGEELSHPVRAGKRAGVKTLAAFQGDPLPREVSAAFVVERSDRRGLGAAIWFGRILVPLGLAGLLLGRKRTGWIVGAAALSGLAAALLTYASPDTRLLTVGAAMVGVAIWIERMIRGSTRIRVAGVLGGAAAVGILGFLPAAGGTPGLQISGDDYFYLGAIYDREKRGSAAIREYERSLRRDPTNPYPHLAIAGMLAADNVNQEAILELEQLRGRYPSFVPGLLGLSRLYQSEQRWRDAAAVFGDLIQLEPWNPEYWNNLGTMYVQLGLYDQAVRALQEALRRAPDYDTARDNLLSLQNQGLAPGAPEGADSLRVAQEKILDHLRQGRKEEAEAELESAYRRFGEKRAELQFVEGTLRLVTGDPARAAELFESVREAMGPNVILLNNLAASYMQMGEREKARAAFQEALRIQPSNERVRRSLEELEASMADSSGSGN